jgi:aerobic carbon-monoxide dehydrogenase medium subunit
VKPPTFTYHLPKTVAEALRLLAELAPQDGRILAGGQSLVPIMAFRLARPAHLIDINAVAGLDVLAVREGVLHIGARTRHAAFHRPVQDGPLGRMLAAVVRHVAHYPIRLRGTFCGSLAHADPAAEWCLVTATLDAELLALSARGERSVYAQDFFQGPMTTALAPDELLAGARLPILPPDTSFGFEEFSRRPGDYALAMALVVLRVEGGRIAAPRIGVGAAEAVPRRIEAAEAALSGRAPGEAVFREAAAAAAGAVEPIEDAQTNAQYRRELVGAMVYRALSQACMWDGESWA